jgi:hypothetical protein
MKTMMFQELEVRCRNWHKEPPSVLWALWTNINIATRDTPFNLVYGADTVLPSEIYLESARVAYFNAKDQTEVRELHSNLLEERRNIVFANVWKYQESLKRYYNKSVIQRELNIGDLSRQSSKLSNFSEKGTQRCDGCASINTCCGLVNVYRAHHQPSAASGKTCQKTED